MLLADNYLNNQHQLKMALTHNAGRPAQFDGSNTFNKQGIPSVGMAPTCIRYMNMQLKIIKNCFSMGSK